MKQALALASLALVLAGCQLPPERNPRPLPDDSGPLPYADLLTRARAQATVATEAFYVNCWAEVEDAARGLEQTARFLQKAEDVPPTHKDTLPKLTSALARDSAKLKEAAIMRNIDDTTVIMRRINLTIREMRLSP
jgi:hypothetical protein